MRHRRGTGVRATLLLSTAALAWTGAAAAQESFVHPPHAQLFPLCTGCHAGVQQGDRSAFFPDPQLCSGCHDGTIVRRVEWQVPEPRVRNLTFQHPGHPAIDCQACHVAPGGGRMDVVPLDPARCLACHAPGASNHFVDAPCATCHVPLANTRFTRQRIASLPIAPYHGEESFLAAGHGERATADAAVCATCHTQDRCASCHVSASSVAAIRAIPAAPPEMELPAMGARYPTPPSHSDPDWIETHGGVASVEACSTCHTREDCATCHVGPPPAAVARIPARAESSAPGVGLAPVVPSSHESPFWTSQHPAYGASDEAYCTTCHLSQFCTDCHDAPASPGFHPRNFAERHAAEAYSQRMECANCHSAEVFCKACHVDAGLGTRGPLGPGFHDAQPLWLLRHGQAARQQLESCASCHEQQTCLQCHSQASPSLQISPHGPGFDAQRARDRNPAVCSVCHVNAPPGREDR